MLKNLANPFHRAGGYVGPHITLVAVIALGYVLALSVGFLGGVRYSENYFRSHYTAPMPLPRAGAAAPVIPRAIPSSDTINLARYPAVGDQGPMGACAAWATAWELSYEWRMQHTTSWLRFAPRQMYDHFSDTYNSGQDGGSWPDQDAEIAPTTGLLQFKAFPFPPYQIDNPIPTYDAYGHVLTTDAAKHRFAVSVHPLGPMTMGGGQGVVDNIESTIASGHAALVALPVYPEYDNATNTGGMIGMPQAGESSRGGHENVAIAYDNTLRFPDGWVGGVEVQNQWNTWWGNNGRGWLETRFVAQYVWGAEWISIGSAGLSNPGPGAPAPGADGGKKPLPAPKITDAPRATGSWYVRPFYTRDTGQNISPILNAAGDAYHLPPTFLLGVTFAESGGYAHSERWAAWPDDSCGLMQQIIQNVWSKIGPTSERAACDWEETPANSIWYGASILRSYEAETGVGPPSLWQCYNAGPGSCRSPYYANFLANYDAALSYGTSQPVRPTFPKAAWNVYRVAHHLRHISSIYNGKRRVEASLWWHGHVRPAGGIVSRPQYVKERYHSFMTTRFQNERLYWWIGTNWVKWIRVRHIG